MKNRQIEGLRGFAIIIILLYHIFYRFQGIYGNYGLSVDYMKHWGEFGVSIFLCISSYFFVDFKKENLNRSFLDFIKRRIFRLYPSYIISITITAIIIHMFYLPNRMSTLKDYLLNLFFLNGFLETPYINGAHWFLNVLLSMIICIGIAKKFSFENKPSFYFIWIFARIGTSFFYIPFLKKFLGGNYFGYIIVVIAIKAIIEKNLNKKELLSWMILFFIGIWCSYFYLGFHILKQLFIILPVLFLCIYNKISVFNNKVLIFLGGISYQLYLIHQNIAFEIEYYCLKYNFGNILVLGVLSIIIVIILALVIYKIEKEILKKNKFKERIRWEKK